MSDRHGRTNPDTRDRGRSMVKGTPRRGLGDLMEQTLDKTLTFPSTLEDALKAEHQVLAEVSSRGYDDDACFAIRLALDEAISNAIQHGNRNDASKKVTVRVTVDADRVKIEVADEGGGFSPACVPDPTAPENLEKPNGRGIMLINAYMTEVAFNDVGNRITMIKRRGCTLPVR